MQEKEGAPLSCSLTDEPTQERTNDQTDGRTSKGLPPALAFPRLPSLPPLEGFPAHFSPSHSLSLSHSSNGQPAIAHSLIHSLPLPSRSRPSPPLAQPLSPFPFLPFPPSSLPGTVLVPRCGCQVGFRGAREQREPARVFEPFVGGKSSAPLWLPLERASELLLGHWSFGAGAAGELLRFLGREVGVPGRELTCSFGDTRLGW